MKKPVTAPRPVMLTSNKKLLKLLPLVHGMSARWDGLPSYSRIVSAGEVLFLIRKTLTKKIIIPLPPGPCLMTVPVNRDHLTLGFDTQPPEDGITPFSADAVKIVTNLYDAEGNLAPKLAKKSGAHLSPMEKEELADAQSWVVPIMAGQYDSAEHPGDISWHSADGNTVVSWWGAGRYGTGGQLWYGNDPKMSPVIFAQQINALATMKPEGQPQPLTTVLDGSMPFAVYGMDSDVSAELAKGGRSYPANAYMVWKNGKPLLSNAPALAHALYGDVLVSLHADQNIYGNEEGTCVIPYIRITTIPDGWDPSAAIKPGDKRERPVVRETRYIKIGVLAGGARVGCLSGSGFLHDAFVVEHFGEFPFYGMFDPSVPKLTFYGVSNSTQNGEMFINGVYQTGLIALPTKKTSVKPDEDSWTYTQAGDLPAPLFEKGSHRKQVMQDEEPAPPTQNEDIDNIEWGSLVPAIRHAGWDRRFHLVLRVSTRFDMTFSSEASTFTPTTDSKTKKTIDRTDDALVARMDVTKEKVEITRAKSISKSTYEYQTKAMHESGVVRKGIVVIGLPDESTDNVICNLGVGLKEYTTLPETTTVTVDDYVYDLSGLVSAESSVSQVSLISYSTTVSLDDMVNAMIQAAGYDGAPFEVPEDSQGDNTLGNDEWFVWLPSIHYARVRAEGGQRVELAKEHFTSAWNVDIGGSGGFGIACDPYTLGYEPLNFSDFLGLDWEYTFINRQVVKQVQDEVSEFISHELKGPGGTLTTSSPYKGEIHDERWFEVDGPELQSRRQHLTKITVKPFNPIIAAGDDRWPIHQMLTVRPWQVADIGGLYSTGWTFHPGQIESRIDSNLNSSTSSSTFKEIKFGAGVSLLTEFKEKYDATLPTWSYESLHAEHGAEMSVYIQAFARAMQLHLGVDRYPGVPSKNEGNYEGRLSAGGSNGLEYFYKYDVSPDKTALFGLPQGKPGTQTYRQCMRIKIETPAEQGSGAQGSGAQGSGAQGSGGSSKTHHIALDGLYGDNGTQPGVKVFYNSPLFIRRFIKT